jgi:histidinol phosphatase-like enzyme
MIFRVDIDGTLCNKTDGKYELAKPIKKNIEKINKLYDEGHKIILWTARGKLTGMDWKELTKKQVKEWGIKFHEISFDKPHFDILFDDKAEKI